MPLFHYHVALDQRAPFPPREELDTVEAPDAQAALDLLPSQLSVKTPPGMKEVWIRVVAAWHSEGAPKYVLSKSFGLSSELN